MRSLSDSALRHYGAKFSTFSKVTLIAIAAVAALAYAAPARSQQPPQVSFNIDAIYEAPNVIPRLQWTVTPASSTCVASGDEAWSGAKPSSGSVALPAVLPPRTYTLTCSTPGDSQAVVTWTAPTLNTDGTPLTDLSRYRVRWGTNPANLTESRFVSGGETSTTITELPPGTWTFGVHAQNTAGIESPMSPTASKTTSATLEVSQTVGVKVPAAPGAPTVQ